MKNGVVIYTIALIMLLSGLAYGQQATIDLQALKFEDYKNAKVKNDQVFQDKSGDSYKIAITDTRRGLFIKKDGKWLKHGVFYSVSSSSGKLSSQTTYIFDIKHGEYISYHANGKVNFLYNYDKGNKHGKWYQYRDDGSLTTEKEFENGTQVGYRIEYHRGSENSNGPVNFKVPYENGKMHGEKLQFNAEGILVSKTTYQNGEKIGKTEWFH